MFRIIACIMTILMFCAPVFPAWAQASRSRLQTQAKNDGLGPASSFRGSANQDFGQPYEELMPGMQIPGSESTMGHMGEESTLLGAGYSVHVLGEVERPGTYIVPASTRVVQAIQRARGISTNGSERNIEVRHKGRKTRHVDLLRFKIHGDLNDNPYLTDNDVVFVPLRNKVVQVVGAVKRPKIYELTSEKSLQSVLKLAGGFNNAVAKNEPIRVIRFEEGKKEVIEIENIDTELSDFSIRSGDVVVVANVITKDTEFDYNVASIPGDQVFYPSYEDRVFVLGGVAVPGAYPFSPYYTLSQYISLAGGLSDRGAESFKVTGIDGKSHKAKLSDKVNPGDTIMVKQKFMSNAAWAGFGLSVASFGLAASSTIIAISK